MIDINLLLSWFSNNIPAQHLSLITVLFVFVWYKSLFNCGFLIDDKEGLLQFSDRWDAKNQKKLTTYKIKKKVDGKDVFTEYQNTAFNPAIEFPASVLRWFRINIGKKHQVIGKNSKGHEVFGYVQNAFRHHVLSLVLHYANLILAYFFLTRLFGSELAFMTVLLFSVYPVSCQTVAWISGIGYLFSLLGILLALNSVLYLTGPYLTLVTVSTFTTFASYALLAGTNVWAILLLLGHYPEAIIAVLVTLVVSHKQWGSIVAFRREEFKKQNMGHSIDFNLRKPIVMLKTLWYYVIFALYPMRLGLFHAWGYHYEEKMERIDRLFFLGLGAAIIALIAVITGPLVVKFSIIWMIVFVATFLNVITAQQFVVDRYLFIPSLGFCLLVAWALTPYPALFYVLLGLYAMRTIIHIPTFRSEIDFYLSNASTSNFLENEVALGNLGVIYMHNGMPGSACDVWLKASKINKFYDVPWYNLYSMFKSNGMLDQAKGYLKSCLDSKTVHFNEQWEKEMEVLTLHIAARKDMPKKIQILNQSVMGARK